MVQLPTRMARVAERHEELLTRKKRVRRDDMPSGSLELTIRAALEARAEGRVGERAGYRLVSRRTTQ